MLSRLEFAQDRLPTSRVSFSVSTEASAASGSEEPASRTERNGEWEGEQQRSDEGVRGFHSGLRATYSPAMPKEYGVHETSV